MMRAEKQNLRRCTLCRLCREVGIQGREIKGSGNGKNETCKGEKVNLKVAAHNSREKKGKVVVQDLA